MRRGAFRSIDLVPYRYLISATLARLADEGARVALVLLTVERTSSAALGGLLIAAFMLPHVVAAPVVGALADRTRYRRLVHAGGPILFAVSLLIAAFGIGRLPDPLVIGVALLGGCTTPLISGGLTGLVRDLVPQANRTRVYGLDGATYNLASICGPPVAAGVAGVLAASTATLFLAVCAGVSGILLSGLRLEARTTEERSSVWAGVSVIWRHPVLRAVTTAASVGTLGWGVLPVAVTLIALQHRNPATAGLLLGAVGLGELCGSLVYARWPIHANRPQQVVMVGLTLSGVPLLLAAASDQVYVMATLLAVSGLFSGPTIVAQFSTRDSAAPSDSNTQLFALAAGLKITAAAIGAGVAGQLAGLGAQSLMILVGACDVVGAGVGFIMLSLRTRQQSG